MCEWEILPIYCSRFLNASIKKPKKQRNNNPKTFVITFCEILTLLNIQLNSRAEE